MTAANWWLRSANSANNFRYVNNNGNLNNNNASNTNGVVLGFGICARNRSSKRMKDGVCQKEQAAYPKREMYASIPAGGRFLHGAELQQPTFHGCRLWA